jgi:hypothetical protein
MGAGILFSRTFYMEKQSSVLDQVKNWLFPGAVTIIGIFAGMMLNDIKSDLSEVKSDVKALMAQSNVDKTRIDNLERQIFKTSTANFPIKDELPKANQYAILTKTKLTKDGF